MQDEPHTKQILMKLFINSFYLVPVLSTSDYRGLSYQHRFIRGGSSDTVSPDA